MEDNSNLYSPLQLLNLENNLSFCSTKFLACKSRIKLTSSLMHLNKELQVIAEYMTESASQCCIKRNSFKGQYVPATLTFMSICLWNLSSWDKSLSWHSYRYELIYMQNHANQRKETYCLAFRLLIQSGIGPVSLFPTRYLAI